MAVAEAPVQELKDQLAHVKGELSKVSAAADNFSKLAGSAQKDAAKVPILEEQIAGLQKSLANANAQAQAAQAEAASLGSQAAKAEAVLAGIKAFKSLLAQV